MVQGHHGPVACRTDHDLIAAPAHAQRRPLFVQCSAMAVDMKNPDNAGRKGIPITPPAMAGMPSDRAPHSVMAREAGQSIYAMLVDIVLTGIVVIVPLVVTVFVLSSALDILASALNPLVRILEWAGLIRDVQRLVLVDFLITVGIYRDVVHLLTEIIAFTVLVVVILLVGTVAHFHYGERVIGYFDRTIARLPAVGALYRSFRQMGDMMLQSDVENFREVKLVEFPHDDIYVVGFETNRSPPTIQAAVEEEGMTTLFLPLAPNPVMGGFLTHVPDERVMDIDMDVEAAVRHVITSGIATGDPGESNFRRLSDDEHRSLLG